jgi:hypothetical protein
MTVKIFPSQKKRGRDFIFTPDIRHLLKSPGKKRPGQKIPPAFSSVERKVC